MRSFAPSTSPVGSSASSRGGSFASATANPARAASPPDKVAGRARSRPVSPTSASRRCRRGRRAIVPGERLGRPDVVPHAEVIEQVARLLQDPDPPRAQRGPLRLRASRDARSHHRDVPAVGFIEPRQAGEQRGLAASRGPDHRDDLTRGDRDRDASQGEGFVITGVVEAIEVARFQDRVGRTVGRESYRHRQAVLRLSVTILQGSTLSAPTGDNKVKVVRVPARNSS